MRSTLNDVYFDSSKSIIFSMRTFLTADEEQKRRQLAQNVNQALQQQKSP